jgi:porin
MKPRTQHIAKHLALGFFVMVIAPGNLSGQDLANSAANVPAPGMTLRDRPSLLDGPGSPITLMREHGVDLGVTYTGFTQSLISGQGDQRWRFGGKLLSKLNLDGRALGLWQGFSLNLVGEWNQGLNVNRAGGTIFNPNTALAFPQNGGSGADLSITLTQSFHERVSLSVGKFNMLDLASGTPLVSGGGVEGFWNIGLAGPFSGLGVPYATGASLSIRTDTAQTSFMIYDPRNSQQRAGIRGWGQEGVTGRFSVTLPAKLAARSGYHTFAVIGSSKTGLNFADIPQLVLPEGSGTSVGTKKGVWYAGYSVQQYVWQDPNRPGAGWGFFGQFGFGDNNPNPLNWMAVAGISGTGLIPGRPLDRFGSGFYQYHLSSELLGGLQALGIDVLRAEKGWETFYTFAITPWFRLTADIQVVTPGDRRRDTAVFVGFGTQVRF